MQFIISLITEHAYLDPPRDVWGWLGWLVLAGLLAWGLFTWWETIRFDKLWRLAAFLVLIIATPMTALFVGWRFSQEQLIPVPGIIAEPYAPSLIIFFALPIFLAGGILGPLPAVILGLLCGFLRALFETHNIFTILEIGLIALLFSAIVRQRYRTLIYEVMRHPLGAGTALVGISIFTHTWTAFFSTHGTLAVRLDYALMQSWQTLLTRSGEIMIACLVCEFLYFTKWKVWGRSELLKASPMEASLQTRFSFGLVVMLFGLVMTLTITDWVVAGDAARRMIRERLSSTAAITAESIPLFLETGQNLIQSLATADLVNTPANQMPETIAARMRAVPYFRQLLLLDASGSSLGGVPLARMEQIRLSKEEETGIQLALRGVAIQTYVVAPMPNENTAQVSYIAAIRDSQNQLKGVLLGRTDLNSNPFTLPAIQSMDLIKQTIVQGVGPGEGFILDEKGYILYHSNPALVMTRYEGRIPSGIAFFDDFSSQGTRRLVYFHPVVGRPWSVVLTVPAELAQQLSLEIALPLLIMLLVLSTLIFGYMRFHLRSVTKSIQTLASEATFIAQDDLDHPLAITGADEVGQLGNAFEQMRVRLRGRREELNRLLQVSQSVAANLNVGKAVQPILVAALGERAALARIVLNREMFPDVQREESLVFGNGRSSDHYAYLDQQVYDLVQEQELLMISSMNRYHRLNIQPGSAPSALIALPLRHESRYFGVLWIAYDQTHNFPAEEIRFLSTLAGQAALAASNASLYAGAEIGRQRLEAVLASTPEPVMVFDQDMRLLLINPAAMQVSGLLSSFMIGKSLKEVISHTGLLSLISQPVEQGSTNGEITLVNERAYHISVSPVLSEDRMVGKVCMLQDITRYKELDTLKDEFVETVSHDLRTPLTLVRGYSTMVSMVGELNEQQKNYVEKIVLSVENMWRLVNNLLDLGRIETGIGLKIDRLVANGIVEQVLLGLQPQATQKNQQLSSHVPEQPVTIEADPALLHQAIFNLAENAIKYTPLSGQINITLSVRDLRAVFEVKDTGIGIAPLDLPHTFEKFYRSKSREAFQQRGTGLGLAIVKSIAERHGGKVWVESQLGKGSSFFLEVPIKTAESPNRNN